MNSWMDNYSNFFKVLGYEVYLCFMGSGTVFLERESEHTLRRERR
jgi:hypothetical protein